MRSRSKMASGDWLLPWTDEGRPELRTCSRDAHPDEHDGHISVYFVEMGYDIVDGNIVFPTTVTPIEHGTGSFFFHGSAAFRRNRRSCRLAFRSIPDCPEWRRQDTIFRIGGPRSPFPWLLWACRCSVARRSCRGGRFQCQVVATTVVLNCNR